VRKSEVLERRKWLYVEILLRPLRSNDISVSVGQFCWEFCGLWIIILKWEEEDNIGISGETMVHGCPWLKRKVNKLIFLDFNFLAGRKAYIQHVKYKKSRILVYIINIIYMSYDGKIVFDNIHFLFYLYNNHCHYCL